MQAAQEGSTTALAVIDKRDENVEQYVRKICSSKEKQITRTNMNYDAYKRGEIAGNNVSLTKKALKGN